MTKNHLKLGALGRLTLDLVNRKMKEQKYTQLLKQSLMQNLYSAAYKKLSTEVRDVKL